MVAEKQNLDLATKADVIRWVQADEMVSAAFLEAFMSTIPRIKPDVKAKAAGPRPGCSGAGRVEISSAPKESSSVTEGDGAECLEAEFRELSALPCAMVQIFYAFTNQSVSYRLSRLQKTL